MKQAWQIFDEVFCKKHLKSVFFSTIRYKRSVGIDGVNGDRFSHDLDTNIQIILKKVQTGKYRFAPYRAKLVSKGHKKFPRLLSIPTVRDKLVLRGLLDLLKGVYSHRLHRKSLHGVINDVNQNVHCGKYDSFIKLDIQNFYPSVKHGILQKKISTRIRKQQIIGLLYAAISNQTKHCETPSSIGIPQGLPVSNILADIYLDDLDKNFSDCSNFAFHRYVDDILILCKNDDIDPIVNDVTNALHNLGLKTHEIGKPSSKSYTGHLSDHVPFLGYVFSLQSVSVRDESVKKMKDSLIAALVAFNRSNNKNEALLEWALNLRITGFVFNETRYGWLHFFSQMTDESLLHTLDHFLRKQIKKFNLERHMGRVKSFVRAWHEINKKRRNSKYIPNLDSFDIDDIRRWLQHVQKIDINNLTDDRAEYIFRKHAYRSISQLQRDLGKTS